MVPIARPPMMLMNRIRMPAVASPRTNLLAPSPRFVLGDQAGIEVGVDRHLLARHGVEGEPRADLRDAPGALGDHDEIDDGQDDEHHDADRVVAADHELAEGLDHVAGGGRTKVPVHQDDARRGDVQGQTQQGRDQQHRREDREIERTADREHGDDDHQRQGDVESEQQVERERRQRQHHHREHGEHTERDADPAQQQLAERDRGRRRVGGRAHASPRGGAAACSTDGSKVGGAGGASPRRRATFSCQT
jgi:hypothetical protein